MKKSSIFLVILVAILAIGWLTFSYILPKNVYNAETQTTEQINTTIPETAQKYSVRSEDAQILWIGRQNLTATEHYGSVSLKSGQLFFDKEKLIGGEFIVDLTTIANQNLSDSSRERLETHLKGEDFFAVDQFPESKFVISMAQPISQNASSTDYLVAGLMTIKDITRDFIFPAKIMMSDGQMTAEANFDLDRTLWNVQYGSGSFFSDLGDRVIDDLISFKISLRAEIAN